MAIYRKLVSLRRNSIFFVVTGPSGVGKTTIMNRVLERDDRLTYSVSHTTRNSRPSEIDGRDYHFVDVRDFESMKDNDEFLEWAKVYGDYYGTSRGEIERIRSEGSDPFLDIDVQGAQKLRSETEFDPVFIFLAPPSYEELERRIVCRGVDDCKSLKTRLRLAKEELTKISEFDYLIVNENLDESVDALECVILAERLKISQV